MSVTEKIANAGGELTDEQMEAIRERARSFVKDAMADPDLMKEAAEKLGGFWGDVVRGFGSAFKSPTGEKSLGSAIGTQVGRALPGTVATGALALGLGMGTDIGRGIVGAAKDRIQKARNYSNMIKENPQLAEFDPNVVQKAFNTLHKFNPAYASDPLVAGTFVANAADQARMDTRTVDSLVQSRKNMADAGGRGSLDFFRQITPKTEAFDPAAQERDIEAHTQRMRDFSRKEELHPFAVEKAPHEVETAGYRAQMGPHDLERAEQGAIRSQEEAARAEVQREEAEAQAAHNELMRQRELQRR